METKPYICSDGSELKDRPMDLTKAQDLAGIGYFLGSDLQELLPRPAGSDLIVFWDDTRKYDVSEFEGLGFLNIKKKLLEDIDIVERLETEKRKLGCDLLVYGIAPYLIQDTDDPRKFTVTVCVYAKHKTLLDGLSDVVHRIDEEGVDNFTLPDVMYKLHHLLRYYGELHYAKIRIEHAKEMLTPAPDAQESVPKTTETKEN
jgi:hypothetical protein